MTVDTNILSPDSKGKFSLVKIARSDVQRIDIVDIDILLTTKSGERFLLPGAGMSAMGEQPPSAIFSDKEVPLDQLLSEVGNVDNLSVDISVKSSLDPSTETKEKEDPKQEQKTEAQPEHQKSAAEQAETLTKNTESSVEKLVEQAKKIDESLHSRDHDYVPPHQYQPPPAPFSAAPGVPPPISMTPYVSLSMGNIVGTTTDTSNPLITFLYGGGGTSGSDAAAQIGPRDALQFSSALIVGTAGNDVIYANGPLVGNATPALDRTHNAKELLLNVAGYFTKLNDIEISGVPSGVSINGATDNGGGNWTLPSTTVVSNGKFSLVYDMDAWRGGSNTFDLSFRVTGTTTRHATFDTTQTFRFQYIDVTDVSQVTDPNLVYTLGGQGRQIYVLPTLAQPSTINSGDGDDIIYGGLNEDTITVGNGNNQIFAGKGDDTVFTGTGNNTISLDDGNNTATAGIGNDIITANNGNNTIDGGNGNNTITMANGNNAVTAGTGNDTVTLGNGNNTINAGDGINLVAVGTGSNSITTGSGDDSITTGSGLATISAGDGINTITTGGGAVDITTGIGNDAITVNGGGGSVTAGDGNNTLLFTTGNYTITAGAGNDTITAGDGNNTVNAGNGTNTITLANGTSNITTGSGNDTITTGSGATTISAGDGINTLVTGGGGVATITTGIGDDSITVNGGGGSIAASDGNNTITATTGDYSITTGSGDDTITAGDGNNTVNAGNGTNSVTTGNGNNTLISGSGNDTLTSGNGTNTFQAGLGNNVISGGTGSDTVDYSNILTTSVSAKLNVNTVVGTGLSDTLSAIDNITGTGMADTLIGNSGNNILIGGAGNDTLAGGDGNNSLTGDAGNDVLTGGAGNDIISGGADNDYIYQGSLANISENFSASATLTYLAGTAVQNNVIAPDGTLTADTLTLHTGIGGGDVYNREYVSAGTTYTISFYAKLGTATNLDVVVNNTSAWNTVGGVEFKAADGLNAATFTRLSYTFVAPLTGQVNIHFGQNSEASLAAKQQTAGTVVLWGFQMDIGSTASDYVPSTTAGGTDTINGGTGDDTFAMPIAGTAYDGGAGIDKIDYSIETTNALTINLLGGFGQFGRANGSTYANIEWVIGGRGNDIMTAGTGTNYTLNGGAGYDYLYNTAGGNATLIGGTGGADFYGGTGTTTMDGSGGGGNGIYYMGRGAETVIGSSSYDELRYWSSGSGVIVNLDNVSHTFVNSLAVTRTVNAFSGQGWGVTAADALSYALGDTYTPVAGNPLIEAIRGSTSDDIVYANSTYGLGWFYGDNGNDQFYGGNGNDRFDISNGNDRADAGAGTDMLYTGNPGWANNFTIYLDGTQDLNSNGLADYLDKGIASLTAGGIAYTGFVTGATGYTLIKSFENILSYTGNDTLVGDGNDNAINARLGSNTIYGLGGNDIITAIEGTNTIDGGAGTDEVNFYNSYSFGGYSSGLSAGVQVFLADANFLGAGSDKTSYWGAGNPFLGFKSYVITNSTYSQITNVENIRGTDFADVLYGNASANSIVGNAGDDIIAGNGGADSLTGGNGNDTFKVLTSEIGSVVSFDGGSGTDTVLCKDLSVTAGSISNSLYVSIETLDIRNGAGGASCAMNANDITRLADNGISSNVTFKLDTGDTFTPTVGAGTGALSYLIASSTATDTIYWFYSDAGHAVLNATNRVAILDVYTG